MKRVAVLTSTATRGVVTVKVFLTTISTGKSTTYEFRVNTSSKYPGPPAPGTGIPVNGPAQNLVTACP